MTKTHHNYILLTTTLLKLTERWNSRGTKEVLEDLRNKLSVVKGIIVNAGAFSISIQYAPYYDDDVEQILSDFKKEYSYS